MLLSISDFKSKKIICLEAAVSTLKTQFIDKMTRTFLLAIQQEKKTLESRGNTWRSSVAVAK